ncbi:MAG: tetraacyldisaccharide 4'-kinase [Chitinispirillia bacterium]|jgi:tetraacyldisaccharide 4'-kinase
MSKLKPLKPGLIPNTLSLLFTVIVHIRNLIYDSFPGLVKKTGRYTISIGGIHAGGTGKTPMAMLVGSYFQKKGIEIAYLSRGYGRKSSSPVIVSPNVQRHWREIGDEPAMIHSSLPNTWLGIGPDRYKNALQISPELSKNAVFILDDGFQHRKIFRNKNILCIPTSVFQDRVLPVGYLREPVSSIKRADIVCLIGLLDETGLMIKIKNKISESFPEIPVHIMHQSVEKWVNLKSGQHLKTLPSKRPLLLSGIANPYRFEKLVRSIGVIPYKIINYEDHHIFKNNEIANEIDSQIDGIITTEKDIIRLSGINLVKWLNIWYLKIKLVFLDNCSQTDFYSNIFRK